MSPEIILTGVLNVTPDSFSDANRYLDPEQAVAHARRLVKDGAAIVDIGGDSTRPGSVCAGEETEWERIGPVVRALAREMPFSVDTHSARIARRAIALGVMMINDISGGADPEMLAEAARGGVKFVLMYSRCSVPHKFDSEPQGDIVRVALDFLIKRAGAAIRAGVKAENIVLDSGMGAFISARPEASYEFIERYAEFVEPGFALMLGISRKGFLKKQGEKSIEERDKVSAELACELVRKIAGRVPLYIRAHDVAGHRSGLPGPPGP